MSRRRGKRVGQVGGIRRASHRHINHPPRSYYRQPTYYRRPADCYMSPGSGICIVLLFFLFILPQMYISPIFFIIVVFIIGIYLFQKQKGPSEPTPTTRPLPSPIYKKPAHAPRPVMISPVTTANSRYCTECGSKLESGDIFCVECGNKVI